MARVGGDWHRHGRRATWAAAWGDLAALFLTLILLIAGWLPGAATGLAGERQSARDLQWQVTAVVPSPQRPVAATPDDLDDAQLPATPAPGRQDAAATASCPSAATPALTRQAASPPARGPPGRAA
ncbi:hypothetical protein ACFQXB_05430 [Plastorhodobacter daqingensis]|uniref:Uncharacterized protein n=1 Tax=Plastorhodobacter daqingensis TaxID=1387281 RepID=A0ABW2UJN9_9RHOB